MSEKKKLVYKGLSKADQEAYVATMMAQAAPATPKPSHKDDDEETFAFKTQQREKEMVAQKRLYTEKAKGLDAQRMINGVLFEKDKVLTLAREDFTSYQWDKFNTMLKLGVLQAG